MLASISELDQPLSDLVDVSTGTRDGFVFCKSHDCSGNSGSDARCELIGVDSRGSVDKEARGHALSRDNNIWMTIHRERAKRYEKWQDTGARFDVRR